MILLDDWGYRPGFQNTISICVVTGFKRSLVKKKFAIKIAPYHHSLKKIVAELIFSAHIITKYIDKKLKHIEEKRPLLLEKKLLRAEKHDSWWFQMSARKITSQNSDIWGRRSYSS